MKSIFRVIILLAVLFGTIGLAQDKVAWAADTPQKTDLSISSPSDASVSPGKDDDDCKDPRNKHRPRCNKDKFKDKIKKFCQKHPRLCQSIFPPPRSLSLSIPVTGDYSVGGLCTLSIAVKDPAVGLQASVIAPIPKGFPAKLLAVTQGCLLEYSGSNQPMKSLLESAGSATICFAAPPDKQAMVYYYNNFSLQPAWAPLETTADVGKACAPANESGIYIGTVAKP